MSGGKKEKKNQKGGVLKNICMYKNLRRLKKKEIFATQKNTQQTEKQTQMRIIIILV